ncbi:unnamed protein product [Cyprideis torosa]|uniref:Uncharacterized protein n=1 Tax=Cyprideis torosa TaxID=163714 RepID=A0A7R8ZJ40_9CRUS|nr:unnamed protein product [Cyprideis torosa]CAG0886060.1 unnamed protein product [Cyprideis torosa]
MSHFLLAFVIKAAEEYVNMMIEKKTPSARRTPRQKGKTGKRTPTGIHLQEEVENWLKGSLYSVDLAGSERQDSILSYLQNPKWRVARQMRWWTDEEEEELDVKRILIAESESICTIPLLPP